MNHRLGRIRDYISYLGDYKSGCVFNQWSETDDQCDLVPDAWINRRLNYEDHLNCEPKLILIGEAPGYQGCRYSGVPFTSERLLFEGSIPRLEYNEGIRVTRRKRPWSEPSATIVWNTLAELGIANETVLLNIFPFHPYKFENPMSNRTPTSRELNETRHLFEIGLDIFDGYDYRMVCVGKTAEKSISDILPDFLHSIQHPANDGTYHFNWEYQTRQCYSVRHPANGGAYYFREQLSNIIKSTGDHNG